MRFPSVGLRIRLFSLVLLAVLPACGLILYSAWQQRQDARTNVQTETLHLAEIGVVQQEQVVEGSRQLLGTIATLASGADVSTIKQEQCGPLFSALLKDFSFYSNIGIATASGAIVCSAVPATGTATQLDSVSYDRAVQTRTLSLGDYAIDKLTGKPTVTIADPILGPAGELKGLMFVAMDLAWVNQQLAATDLPAGANFSIIDRNGVVLARTPDPDRWTGQRVPDSTIALLGAPRGASDVAGIDGVTRLTAVTPITGVVDTGLYAVVGIPLGTAYSSVNADLIRNLIGLGIAAALALAAAWIGGEIFLLRQTRALVTATKRLAQGDMTARSGLGRGSDEIHELARHFDEMAADLERRSAERAEAAEKLRAANESLEQRVQERTLSVARHAEDLARSNTELEDFTHVVSHDLKEPLRGIEAFSGFLAKDYAEKLDDRGRKYLSVLQDSAVRMRDLIDDLLQLSRIGRTKPQHVPVSISALLTEIRDAIGFSLDDRNVDLRVQSDLPTVVCDPVRIRQVFENLISNAIKYNQSEAPIIEIACAQGSESYTFSVHDNGPGIDPKYHKKIFQIFQRLVLREEYEGTGVGLTICKKIVEGHGGLIWVDSDGEGAGSTFSFSIPNSIEPSSSLKEGPNGEQPAARTYSAGGGQSERRGDNDEGAGGGPGVEPAHSGAGRAAGA
jgi:signal transduction histidine kinase